MECCGTFSRVCQTKGLVRGQQQGDMVMDFSARGSHIAEDLTDGDEQRAAPRFTLLIRAAKLVCEVGEFVCVIRDVSETGVSMRLFHALPVAESFDLHMPAGGIYPITQVWHRGQEAGFRFAEPLDVGLLINEASAYPKRGLRLKLAFPVTLATLTQRCCGVVHNFSQQGALVETEGLFAIDQTLRIEASEIAPELKVIRAKVRWRRGTRYGVVFDDTFTLGDFAKVAAAIQAPHLVAARPA
jgi:hypothetical protein